MQPLRAHSWAEACLYLKVTPCGSCSQGPWELQADDRGPAGRTLLARCAHCGHQRRFLFDVGAPAALPPDLAELADEIVNPTDEPSRIIDLGQWLSLFYLLADSAHRAGKGREARRLTFQAAQCVEEALKFYGPEDESPPETALASEASRQAFAEHPERFARQRLRDMRGRLPDMRVMVQRLTRDAAGEKRRPWWKFWGR